MMQISQLEWANTKDFDPVRGTGAVQIAHTGFPGHLNDIAIFAISSHYYSDGISHQHSFRPRSVSLGGKLNDDLTEMAAFFHKVQGLRHSIESNRPVNYGLHVVALNSRDHLFEHSPAPDRQADHMQILPKQARNRDLLREARQHTNHQDRSANPRRFDRLLQCILAANFDDVVHTTARPMRSCFPPIGNRAIVDRVVRPELRRALDEVFTDPRFLIEDRRQRWKSPSISCLRPLPASAISSAESFSFQ